MSALLRLTVLLTLLVVWGTTAVVRAETPPINYMLQCQGCHLADGAGSPGAVPPLRNLVGKFLRVSGGREYLIRVPGSAQSALSNRELAELLSWIIRRFGPEQDAANLAPFSAEEVGSARGRPLIDVESVRRDLLRRIAARDLSSSGPEGP